VQGGPHAGPRSAPPCPVNACALPGRAVKDRSEPVHPGRPGGFRSRTGRNGPPAGRMTTRPRCAECCGRCASGRGRAGTSVFVQACGAPIMTLTARRSTGPALGVPNASVPFPTDRREATGDVRSLCESLPPPARKTAVERGESSLAARPVGRLERRMAGQTALLPGSNPGQRAMQVRLAHGAGRSARRVPSAPSGRLPGAPYRAVCDRVPDEPSDNRARGAETGVSVFAASDIWKRLFSITLGNAQVRALFWAPLAARRRAPPTETGVPSRWTNLPGS
jgi:hypothetical protein